MVVDDKLSELGKLIEIRAEEILRAKARRGELLIEEGATPHEGTSKLSPSSTQHKSGRLQSIAAETMFGKASDEKMKAESKGASPKFNRRGSVSRRLSIMSKRPSFINNPINTIKRVRKIKGRRQRQRYIKLLKGTSVMKTLDAEQLEEIVELLTLREFYKGQYIIREGDVGDAMFIIDEGEVEVYKFLDGKQKLLATLGKGVCLGELALMTDGRRTASVIAKGEVSAFYITQSIFKEYMEGSMQEDARGAQQHILQHEILEKVPCFKSLVEEDRKKALEVMRPQHFAQGDYIVRQGEEGDTFFIILTGKVRCTVNDSGVMGGERTVAVLGANEFVEKLALLEDVPDGHLYCRYADGDDHDDA